MNSKALAQEILVALERALSEEGLVKIKNHYHFFYDEAGHWTGHVDPGELGECLADHLVVSPIKEARELGKELALLSHLPKEES